jgi:hypothetical protein
MHFPSRHIFALSFIGLGFCLPLAASGASSAGRGSPPISAQERQGRANGIADGNTRAMRARSTIGSGRLQAGLDAGMWINQHISFVLLPLIYVVLSLGHPQQWPRRFQIGSFFHPKLLANQIRSPRAFDK